MQVAPFTRQTLLSAIRPLSQVFAAAYGCGIVKQGPLVSASPNYNLTLLFEDSTYSTLRIRL